MELVIKVRLYFEPYTVFGLSEEELVLEEVVWRATGVEPGPCQAVDSYPAVDFDGPRLRLKATAFLLKELVRAARDCSVFRANLVKRLQMRAKHPAPTLTLNLVPPEREIIDYLWNDRMLRLVWCRVEIENAYSWLSTLGGAYSALGDYFEHCAEEAGRIAVRQWRLALLLGDSGLAARSVLYGALALAQRGQHVRARSRLRAARAHAAAARDLRLLRMCAGARAKLKHLRHTQVPCVS